MRIAARVLNRIARLWRQKAPAPSAGNNVFFLYYFRILEDVGFKNGCVLGYMVMGF